MKQLSLKEKALFFNQLSRLLKSGVPINEALKVISEQYSDGIRDKILSVSRELESGVTFSEAMRGISFIDDETKSVFKVAEENAYLEEALMEAALWLGKKDEFKKCIQRALIYPVIVFLSSISCAGLMFLFVLPSYMNIFSSFDIEIPLMTQIVFNLPKVGFVALLFVALAVFLAVKKEKNADFMSKIPVVNKIYLYIILKDFCLALSYQLKAGLSVFRALNNLNIPNQRIMDSIGRAMGNLEAGIPLKDAFSKEKIFNDYYFLQLISTGEHSGDLAASFQSASEHFGDKAQNALKDITVYFEPIATLAVGVIVAIVAISMIIPLFSIMNSVM